ncbi:MAG: integrase [Nitrospinae bacterium]|nr:integrase [Nitrospinota bacterium]MBF0634630.1 integrase [Nitrospinota bacterium]
MSVMVFELYDALKDAGASEEKAQAAAKAIADYHTRFDHIDSKLAILEAKITILQCVMGLALAGVISLVVKAFV